MKDLLVADRKPLIVAGIPAYNEELTIAKEVLRTKRHADRVFVCDDGSTDMTAEIAETVGAEVIKHGRNLGKGAALRSLFEVGRKIDADVFVTLDADDQHEPSEIPKLVDPILRGEADVVIGNRFSPGFGNHIPPHRKFGNAILNFFTNLSTKGLQDTQSGFRAYSRAALDAVDAVVRGLGVDSQILIDAKKKNMKIVEVPVSVKYPKGVKTSKRDPLQHGADVILALIQLVGEGRPLLFLGFPGAVLFVVGGASFGMGLKTFSETRQFAIGTSISGVAWALFGALLVFGSLILCVTSMRLKNRENGTANWH